ncbi:hypothetical protein ABLE93_25430 [Xanthobacter sp. KR7-65]|uniref:hypothetical protein n=1 Tax=Xanthobacter sp. KR7-65 TaxID=3156612 RepID=UPI0032B5703B
MKRTQPSRPTHEVYVVEGEGEQAFWTRVGAAWSHQDSDGFNVQLSCMPVDGRLVIRRRKEQSHREAGR